jgi:hypothetical protein
MGYAVYVNVADVPDSFFNPQPENITQFLSLEYPPISGYAIQGDLIHINIYLTTKGNFVQGQNVIMSVSGSISDRFIKNLFTDYSTNASYIYVGLEGASHVMDGMISIPIGGPPVAGVPLFINYTNPNAPQTLALGNITLGGPTQTIVWQFPGDYHPGISIILKNNTLEEKSYDNFIVHVNPIETLQTARYNRISEVLTIVLVVFGFVEAAKIVIDSFKKRENKRR